MCVRTPALAVALSLLAGAAWAQQEAQRGVQLGPRPFYLVEDMDKSELKSALQACVGGNLGSADASRAGAFVPTDFSIGHRGAPLQFPEHTKESYEAAARMGAGIIECDVTFTKDRELVCRHAQCDLHTTTNILAVPELAAKCSEPFTPADPAAGREASAKCCTSDLTLAEFRQLEGKMDAHDPDATTVEAYMAATAPWRTDLYAPGTLMTHAESIELFKSLGAKFTPELKTPEVAMPFEGYTQAQYAQQLIDEYKAAGVPPQDVYPQSFNLDDVRYWIANEPDFGAQAVYLDGRDSEPGFDVTDPSTWSPGMQELADAGVKILAPPMWMLLALNQDGEIVPSVYAQQAKAAGLEIITWTLERSGPLDGGGGSYYQTVTAAIDNDGDMLEVLDVLAQDVGILGIFSDWPATVTFYANCMGLK
jgi:glycerophosphoryl diester phosphodiesterase